MSRVSMFSIFDSTGQVFIFLADTENEIVSESDCKCRVDFRCFYNVKKIFTSWPKDRERHSAVVEQGRETGYPCVPWSR